MAAKKSPAPASNPALIGARTLARGASIWRVACADRAIVEQIGDGAPRSRKLTDDDAVVRAVDEAIAKRLAEGFVEITAPLGPDVAATPCFDAAALATIHPTRRFPGPPRETDPEAAIRAIREAAAALAGYLEDTLAGAEEETRAEIEGAVAWLRRPDAAPLPPRGSLALTAFLLAAHPDPAVLTALIDRVATHADVAAATGTLVGYLERCESWVAMPIGDDAVRQQAGGDFAAGPGPWRALRAHLAHASEAEYAAARAVAEAARAGAGRARRVPLAYAFPDIPAWANEDALAASAQKQRVRSLAPERWLLTAANDAQALYLLGHDLEPLDVLWRGRTPATAAAWLAVVKGRSGITLELLALLDTLRGDPADDVTLSMVAVAGDDALRGLEMVRDRATIVDHPYPCRLAAQRAVLRALGCLPTDAGLAHAISQSRYRRFETISAFATLQALAEKAPRRALVALAREALACSRFAMPEPPPPLHERLARDLARRIDRADVPPTGDAALDAILTGYFGAPAATPSPARTPLGRAMLSGDAEAILAAFEQATEADLDADAGLFEDRVEGLAKRCSAEVIEVLERRFPESLCAVRITAELHLWRSDNQSACDVVARYLKQHEDEAAFAYLLELLGRVFCEVEDALLLHVQRGSSPEDRARRAERIAEAALASGEGEAVAARWRDRGAG